MVKGLEYSAALTGASFLLYELKQVLKLKKQGLSDAEIKKKVVEDNIFEYRTTSSLKRSLPSVIRRLNVIDDTLCDLLLESPLEVSKIINLYAIMKTDRLFFEFMKEVIQEKLEANNYLLEKKDLNIFFLSKTEQDEKVAKWTELTINKLKQVYIKLLLEAGLLRDKKSGELNRLLIDEELKRHFISIGDFSYLQAMGE
ncbi:DUF1819 family protein [Bacillus cereus group sp. Bc222]|uniref:DUF1819 family protein n=1 Tax=Bacillus cereus group TaxID=86661 RepID=UPI0009430360|nr:MULTISPECIES: DUF1819 family protein [Bacillus cereus group]MBL3741557.1 DUF1819 family protein [Bacillus cereus]MBL3864212.1 DUF1819 family protein [Bacillus cereus]MDA2241620.1 DUF1819 family protein [Bacillus cereus group sp. Bc222]HDR8321576.1 DUF1819 family protein [Bacillus cereus]HDR8328393.1 DUF1819 family protein [Bacillus cereus]